MKGETCIGPECDREQMARWNVCTTHRAQLKAGNPLTPIGSTQNARTYPADAICDFDGCLRPRQANIWCSVHYVQHKEGREMTPVGSTFGRKKMKKGFSDTRKCYTCKETKKWNLFVIGLENGLKKQPECKQCFHDRVMVPKVEYVKDNNNWEDLMGFLEMAGKEES